MLDVERWAELRREHFVRGVGVRELARRYGISRNTVRVALRSEAPPAFRCPERRSKLDEFKDEIHELLRRDPRLPAVRMRELIEPLGFTGGQTIVNEYLREVRPLFERRRTFQRTVYRPGEICQFDLWHVTRAGARRAWPDPAGVCRGRGAGVLAGRDRRADLQSPGWGRAVGYGSLFVVAARPARCAGVGPEGCLHAGGGRPTESYAAFCGQLRVDWCFCEPADPQAKGVVERLQGYMETNFEPGRRFANHLDFQLQLDAWFAKANSRTHKTLRCRPVDRLCEEHAVMAPLPAREPDLDERIVLRVPADPHVRIDTNDYSLDPALVGRRVEVRVSQRQITAVALDTGELACRHERSFAKHRTITALEHARALRADRPRPEHRLEVQVRSLADYDRLIA